MYRSEITSLTSDCHQYRLYQEEKALTFRRVIELWGSSATFRTFYSRALADSPFSAFFWEHPPINAHQLDREYEFVLVESPGLKGVTANPSPFSAYFQTNQLVVDFPNLGGDAHLLAPVPIDDLDFPHLASFCRTATREQADTFWQKLGDLLSAKMSKEPKWLSTSGLGVHWLHVRWERFPKYYVYREYRDRK